MTGPPNRMGFSCKLLWLPSRQKQRAQIFNIQRYILPSSKNQETNPELGPLIGRGCRALPPPAAPRPPHATGSAAEAVPRAATICRHLPRRGRPTSAAHWLPLLPATVPLPLFIYSWIFAI
ncbi:hypothetical protein B0H14DRAFT_2642696 [Mycena olivaceomarginata]|nr:hypothetical protein B0H14DRAFT_2642696 [Mycena olivaceomarginata]